MAAYFTSQLGVQNAGYAYVGASAAADGRKLLGAVSATTDTAAYQNTVASDVAALKAGVVLSTNATLALFAGNMDISGNADGTGGAARFYGPFGVTLDGAGNLYVADSYNNTVRKITPAGVVTTLAGTAGVTGSADGFGAAASFNLAAVAADAAGNVYVADSANHEIRKITPAGSVSTLAGLAGVSGSADGTGSTARFNLPVGIATDATGNVYVADTQNQTIRKITPGGVVTTIAGQAGVSGSADALLGTSARFNRPSALTVDNAGNIFVADSANYTIRQITPSGAVSTVAGNAGVHGHVDGDSATALLSGSQGIAVDNGGNVYLSEILGNIRKIAINSALTRVSTIAGTLGSPGFQAGPLPGVLESTYGIAIRGRTMYIATGNGIAVINNLP